jgi:hypothetical protein
MVDSWQCGDWRLETYGTFPPTGPPPSLLARSHGSARLVALPDTPNTPNMPPTRHVSYLKRDGTTALQLLYPSARQPASEAG